MLTSLSKRRNISATMEGEDKGKFFIRRVKDVLTQQKSITVEESLEKVEEMRELMITMAKMLKSAIQKIKVAEEEKELLETENKALLDLLNKMEAHLTKAEDNLTRFTSKCKQFEELREKYELLRTDLETMRKKETDLESKPASQENIAKETKSKKTQTLSLNNIQCYSLTKFENGEPMCEDYAFTNSTFNSEIDLSLQKLQSFLLLKEKKWHQTSGREREQRVKISRLVKQLKMLQNQLDWKNNQLSFKEAEIKEKKIELTDAERKIQELKKLISANKKCRQDAAVYNRRHQYTSIRISTEVVSLDFTPTLKRNDNSDTVKRFMEPNINVSNNLLTSVLQPDSTTLITKVNRINTPLCQLLRRWTNIAVMTNFVLRNSYL